MTAAPPHDPWFAPDARTRVAEVVRTIEARTSAELVVTVRAASDAYRDADLISGLLLGFAVLIAHLYIPDLLPHTFVGPAVALAFIVGVVLSRTSPAIRRTVLARARQHAAVRAAAREAFVDQNIASTRGRTGVLVFVSLLERRVEVVPDIGVVNAPLPGHWDAALVALARSLERGHDLAAFEQALAALASPLAHALPRQEADLNELPDEVRA